MAVSTDQSIEIVTDVIDAQNALLGVLASNADIYLTSSSWETKAWSRETISLNMIDHITKYVLVMSQY
jgi:hypothetical protein